MLAFDTNIVFHASNLQSPKHTVALRFLEALREDSGVVVSELMLTELYGLLRNPVLNRKPLSPAAATQIVQAYRRHPKWRLVGLPSGSRLFHDEIWRMTARPSFPHRRIYDVRMGLSLVHQGVAEFATANTKDFQGLGFVRVWNPLTAG